MRLRERQCAPLQAKRGGNITSVGVWMPQEQRMPGRAALWCITPMCLGTMQCLSLAIDWPIPCDWGAPGHVVHQTSPAALNCSVLCIPGPCHRFLTWQTLATPLKSPGGQTHSPPQPFPPSVGRRQALRGSAACWDQTCYDSSSSDSSRNGGGAASSSSSSGSSSQSALSEW